MLKNLKLAQAAAEAAGADTALGRHAAEIYAAFAEQGQAGKDFSAIIEAVREGYPGLPKDRRAPDVGR